MIYSVAPWRFLLLICVAIISCTPTPNSTESSTETQPGFMRSQLPEVLQRNTPFLHLYTEFTKNGRSYEDWCNQESMSIRFQQIRCQEALNVDDTDILRSKTTMLGSPQRHPYLHNLLQELSITINDSAIVIEDIAFEGKNLLLDINWFPHPQNLQMPVRLVTSASQEIIWEYIFAPPTTTSAADIKIYDGAQLQGSLHFSENYKIDKNSLIRNAKQVSITGAQWGISYQGTAQVSNQYWKHWQVARQDLLNTFPDIEPKEDVQVYFYNSAEAKALKTQNMDACHIQDATAHTIHNGIYSSSIPAPWIVQTLRQSESLIHPEWYTVIAEYIAVKHSTVESSQAHNTLLLDLGIGYQDWLQPRIGDSPIIRKMYSYAFVDFILNEYEGGYQLLYSAPGEKTREVFQTCLARARKMGATERDRRPHQVNRLRGFNFAHEGYNIVDGYASQEALHMIQKQKSLGANTISIVPYTYLRNPRIVDRLPVVRQAGAENDGSVAHAAYQARKLGLHVLLKPQIYIPRSWPGDLYWEGDEAELFQRYYRHWMVHYALLGESLQVDALCIGTELVQLSLGYPEYWQSLIREIRSLYSGQLTYAANWGEEMETLSFWNELDYIGCNCYYPLSSVLHPNDRDLRDGLESMFSTLRQISDANDRPIWLTEIGFKSIQAPWRQPHDDQLDGESNQEDQAHIYSLLCESLPHQEIIHGLWWWKWPSYLDYAESHPEGFSPATKAAESVIKSCWVGQ